MLTEALGPLLTSAYVAVKRLESRYFADKSPEEEARRHFAKYWRWDIDTGGNRVG